MVRVLPDQTRTIVRSVSTPGTHRRACPVTRSVCAAARCSSRHRRPGSAARGRYHSVGRRDRRRYREHQQDSRSAGADRQGSL